MRRVKENPPYATASPHAQAQSSIQPAANQPDGQITSDFQKLRQARESKIFLFSSDPNHRHIMAIPSYSEGRWPSSRTLGRGAVDAAASGARVVAGRVSRERSNGAQTNDADAYGKTVWSWHPLLVSSWRRLFEPDRVSINHQSVGDGDKTNSSPGRARHKP